MKKWMIVFMVFFVFNIPAYAQMGMMGGQQGEGQGNDGRRTTDAYDELSDDAADARTRNGARWPADANDADDGSGYDDAKYDADDDGHDEYAGKDDDGR